MSHSKLSWWLRDDGDGSKFVVGAPRAVVMAGVELLDAVMAVAGDLTTSLDEVFSVQLLAVVVAGFDDTSPLKWKIFKNIF